MLFLTEKRRSGLLIAVTFLTFFALLGSRALNEPDEGRYAEIAREMVATGDWLVPQLWYVPHLDKPPMTYWLVAASMKVFGQNEWAVRLPLALAGISGVWATFLLGRAVNGRRTGWWSALILQSSLLYFAMARMLTTDLFLTVFTVWTVYFFWRSWQSLTGPDGGVRRGGFFGWHLAGWTALAPGFLTKGPIALAMPMVAFGVLLLFRRRTIRGKKVLAAGLAAGFIWFILLAAPWYLLVFRREPGSAHYMIFGQVAGHLLGTTIKNRNGSPLYFFGIIAVGLLPWTGLLGWLWRRRHWRGLTEPAKDAWLALNAWAIFTFTLFSLSHAKLPAYILPIFPALAILLAWRFFDEADGGTGAVREGVPGAAWRFGLAGALLLPAVFPLALALVFKDTLPLWLKWQGPVAAAAAAGLFLAARKWNWRTVAMGCAVLAVPGYLLTVVEISMFDTSLRGNQTLEPLGAALRENYEAGDAVVCWGRLPQGLPFYAGGVISATNRPYFGGIDDNQMPFDYPGNRERVGERLLPDDQALVELLHSDRRVLVAGFNRNLETFQREHPDNGLQVIARSGQWELLANRPRQAK